MAKKATTLDVNEEYLVVEAEQQLWSDIQYVENTTALLMAKRSYSEALTIISMMEENISAFFDSVMVMDENENIKTNRLALLGRISRLAGQIADLSKIVQQ